MGIEIERKFLVKEIPKDYGQGIILQIEQGYLNVSPAIRVRRQGESYFLTYKGGRGGFDNAGGGAENGSLYDGGIGQMEYNLPLDADTYAHLLEKADGHIIRKTRCILPLNENAYDEEFLENNAGVKARVNMGTIKIELDIFKVPHEGLVLAEVEFPSEEAAAAYHPAPWFDREVTYDPEYSNAHLSMRD